MNIFNSTAEKWFAQGKRIPYNPKERKVLLHDEKKSLNDILHVFRILIKNKSDTTNWITMMPGFPDGSFGWSRVEQHLKQHITTSRLYVEYIGQGDSDKPNKYKYSTIERADLIEAHWKAYNIKNTFLVTFDYSSLAALELLRRQQEKLERGEQLSTIINRVLFINGGLFADAHSHPVLTTPLLKTSFGKKGTQMAQKSHLVFNLMMKGLWSKEYGVTKNELSEVFNVITRRNGALFMSNAAGFVDEHKAHANRWDLHAIYKEMNKDVSFHIVGSEKDQFEPKQIIKARERLGMYGVDIRLIPGGHMSTSEQPELLANIIVELNNHTS